jgi:hypothetical protein
VTTIQKYLSALIISAAVVSFTSGCSLYRSADRIEFEENSASRPVLKTGILLISCELISNSENSLANQTSGHTLTPAADGTSIATVDLNSNRYHLCISAELSLRSQNEIENEIQAVLPLLICPQ